VSHKDVKQDALDNLADALTQDILDTPDNELLREVEEDYGDPRALANKFDQILDRTEKQVSGTSRRTGGRLSLEDQRRLGDILQRVYDDIVRQGVPDRFKILLNELNDEREPGQAAAYGQGEVHARGAGREDVASDRTMDAKSMDDSRRKGSQR
jgi:hypothetical protein